MIQHSCPWPHVAHDWKCGLSTMRWCCRQKMHTRFGRLNARKNAKYCISILYYVLKRQYFRHIKILIKFHFLLIFLKCGYQKRLKLDNFNCTSTIEIVLLLDSAPLGQVLWGGSRDHVGTEANSASIHREAAQTFSLESGAL